MKRLISIAAVIVMSAAPCFNIFVASAQSTASQPGYSQNMPSLAVIGSTAERRAAWEGMTPAQRDALISRANSEAAAARQSGQLNTVQPMNSSPVSSSLTLKDSNGSYEYLAASEEYVGNSDKNTPNVSTASTDFNVYSPAPKRTRSCSTFPRRNPDCDGDGLGDSFEAAVSDIFTPYYHVSAGEPNNFARFADSVPQTVTQLLPQVPVTTHFRVKPIGIGTEIATGREVSVLRVDYLTLWDRDGGLDSGGDCAFGLAVAGGLIGIGLSASLDGLGSHELDNERSAVLLVAPTTSPGVLNQNPQSYSLYKVFTSGHEGQPVVDQSFIISLNTPVPATAQRTHIELYLSRSKHATYTFNPDDYPIIHSLTSLLLTIR